MDIFLIILGSLFLLAGIIGCIVPALPGVPLSYVALLLLQLTDRVQFSWQFLVIWLAVTILVQVLDTFIPVWGTKRMGGSKAGTWGATLGLVAGMFLGVWGIILGPFVGAVLFELIAGKRAGVAIKAGVGSFVGILTGTVLKLICSGMMTYYFIKALVA